MYSKVEEASAEATNSAHNQKPAAFCTAHEIKTIQSLCNWIIPPDERSGGAGEQATLEFIDLMMSLRPRLPFVTEAADVIIRGGLCWLNHQMLSRTGKTFVEATLDQQQEMLDLIASRRQATPALLPGIRFFAILRAIVAEAFYTGEEGIRDLAYVGNQVCDRFEGCGDHIFQQLLMRSPLVNKGSVTTSK